jgi:hypothetical protein
VPGAVGDQVLGQIEGPVGLPNVLREYQYRVRSPQVQEFGAARADLAEADLTLAGAKSPARRFVERGKQGRDAVVLAASRNVRV